VRSTDLPDLVRDGTVHLGITGNDYAIESRAQVLELADLNMCPGQLCLLVGQSEPLRTIADLPDDTSVVTQYPVCAERFVLPDLPRARIRAVDGAAEVYPTLGLCRAILDVVVTGETARSNGLRVLATFLRTSARLYSSRFAMDPRNGLQPQLDRLVESLARERSGIGPLAERSGLA
jgi:ATP phosphoribosyltransferase